MDKHTLIADKRDIVGRKVKKLRKIGKIPATIYGKNIKSTSVAVDADAFGAVYAAAGETGLVDLSLDGAVRPVLVHTVQKDPVTDAILHVELHQVDLKEKVRANVPLVLVGESPAVAEKKGVLLTILDEVEVEALPTDLIDKIDVDVGALADVDDEVNIKDLKIPSGITLLSDPELTVVKIDPLVTKEAEAEAAAEEAAKAAAVAESAPPAEEEAPQEKLKEEVKEEAPHP